MNRSQIAAAKFLALEFANRCDALIEVLDREVVERHERDPGYFDGKKRPSDSTSGKVSGALRRCSLELTRQLAEMRRP